MSEIWVDPLTGFGAEDPAPGREPVNLEHDLPWYSLLEGDRLLAWYSEHEAKCAAEEAGIQERARRLLDGITAQRDAALRVIEARRKAREWLVGGRVREEVRARTSSGRRRSIDTEWARLGFRRSARVEVRDEPLALSWARAACPEAIRVRESIRVSALPETALRDHEIPGVGIVEEDRFYCRPAGAGEE